MFGEMDAIKTALGSWLGALEEGGASSEEFDAPLRAEAYRAIVGVREIRRLALSEMQISSVFYDAWTKEYQLLDMMMRSIVRRHVIAYRNVVADVYIMADKRDANRLFVYHDKVTGRSHLVLLGKPLFDFFDSPDFCDTDIESLRNYIFESGAMVAHKTHKERGEFEVLSPRVEEAFEEWESGYRPLPGQCC